VTLLVDTFLREPSHRHCNGLIVLSVVEEKGITTLFLESTFPSE
jgi:hypothetical protein